MNRQLVYDLPTRAFHWMFAGLFVVAFGIGKTIDDEELLFAYHKIAGLTLGFLIFARIVWGFKGSTHARFSGFALKPSELIGYFRGILKGDKRRWAGHNPASSWAALAMMALGLCLGVTGILMSTGQESKLLEEIHEILAHGFLVVVLGHIAGIALHTFRHRELIGLSMVDGKKADVPEADTIDSAHVIQGLMFAGIVIAFALHLLSNFDKSTQTLKVFGAKLELGHAHEGEHEEEHESEHED